MLALVLALGQSGCESPNMTPQGLAGDPPPSDEAQLRPYTEVMSERYAANPDDKTVALRYATALRRLTQYAQACRGSAAARG